MACYILTRPTAALSRGIENLVIYAEHSNVLVGKTCAVSARILSVSLFPLFLLLEATFLRLPKMVLAIGTEKFYPKADKVLKYVLSIPAAAVLGAHSPDGVPGFFLKRHNTSEEIRPFGVEALFGKKVHPRMDYPRNEGDVQRIVQEARLKKQQISVVGAGMSQGTQTVPQNNDHRVIHTKYLNQVQVDVNANTVTVGGGATWEKIQLALDKVNKSSIVKQASDPFSIGGSIGINCHGWAHAQGAISSTVRCMKVVDANGNLRVLHRPRPWVAMEHLTDEEKLFKCMFGTLGYFGVVVEATLDIVDNEELIEVTKVVDRDQFAEAYQQIKDQNVPLFGGRLVLDTLKGDPLREVCMVSYRRPDVYTPLSSRRIDAEPKFGLRVHRIALKLIAHLSNFSVKRMISWLWDREKAAMFSRRAVTRNEALHPPINAFNVLHRSDLHAQWLQEYFITKENLPNFLRFLGAELKANDVRLINATIRPTPRDAFSILPYAEQDRFAVVICFAQFKTEDAIAKTKKWIENVNAYLAMGNGVFYQAYMPYATRQQFETCYGHDRVNEMRRWKEYFDPDHVFGNAHTAKYYDAEGG